MAAALNLIAPVPAAAMVILITVTVLALQIWSSYHLIRSIFRWLALAFLAYLGSAVLAHPGLIPTIKGTLIPTIRLDREFLEMLVAIIGTSLSAYLYTWQSNQDVEEDISMGRRRLVDRTGPPKEEMSPSARDIAVGMFLSSLVMYFIILSTGATLFKAGELGIYTPAGAALPLPPLAA